MGVHFQNGSSMPYAKDFAFHKRYFCFFPGLREYCVFESFNATCRPNEAIIIKRAYYGRMRTGRCVEKDLGYVGCKADVQGILSRRCSGRRHCSVSVLDKQLTSTQPCSEQVSWYLEAEYECVKGGLESSERERS